MNEITLIPNSTMGGGLNDQNFDDLNHFNTNQTAANGAGRSSMYEEDSSLSGREARYRNQNRSHHEQMRFQEHHDRQQQLQQQQHLHRQHHQQQKHQQRRYDINQHTQIQKIQQQHHHNLQQQKHFFDQQKKRQPQASSRTYDGYRMSGSSRYNGKTNPNQFHQRLKEQQEFQLKLQLQQDKHMKQQQSKPQNDHTQNMLPTHQAYQQQIGPLGRFESMADPRLRQNHEVASANSCTPDIWGVPPPGAQLSQQHRNLSEKELTPSRFENTSSNNGVNPSQTDSKTAVSGRNTELQKNKDPKRALRSERKREQEKQRRFDLNEKFTALIEVVKRIETEDDEIERKKQQDQEEKLKTTSTTEKTIADSQANKNKKRGRNQRNVKDAEGPNNNIEEDFHQQPETSKKKQKVDMLSSSEISTAVVISAARCDFRRRFPCFISSSNRSDLIARAISHLVRFGFMRNKLCDDIDAMREELRDVKRANNESEYKLQQMGGGNNFGMMKTPPMNQMYAEDNQSGGVTADFKKPISTSDNIENQSPSAVITTEDGMRQNEDGSQQKLQQQQQCQVRRS